MMKLILTKTQYFNLMQHFLKSLANGYNLTQVHISTMMEAFFMLNKFIRLINKLV